MVEKNAQFLGCPTIGQHEVRLIAPKMVQNAAQPTISGRTCIFLILAATPRSLPSGLFSTRVTVAWQQTHRLFPLVSSGGKIRTISTSFPGSIGKSV
jgi:hypothetical protein